MMLASLIEMSVPEYEDSKKSEQVNLNIADLTTSVIGFRKLHVVAGNAIIPDDSVSAVGNVFNAGVTAESRID